MQKNNLFLFDHIIYIYIYYRIYIYNILKNYFFLFFLKLPYTFLILKYKHNLKYILNYKENMKH